MRTCTQLDNEDELDIGSRGLQSPAILVNRPDSSCFQCSMLRKDGGPGL